MINKTQVIFCDNEHGIGDVCFPDIGNMDEHSIKQLFINGPPSIRALRLDAKKAGWGRVNGGDYCPGCMQSGT
jgi:hypothetical protein